MRKVPAARSPCGFRLRASALVLVIEDEASYVEALEVALGREGFQVHSVPDGPQGLVGFREDPPDVVLLDLMLPGMSGVDVLRKIREAGTTPVIVVSAKDSEADVVSALELGADDYLTKPYSVRELVARIHVATRRANRRKLEAAPDAPTIETVRGVGSRLETPNRS